MIEENGIEETELSDDSSVIKELRQQIKDLKSENSVYKPLVQDKVFQEAGVDVNTPFGKAVSKLYKGPLETSALRDFVAEEFGEAPVADTTQPIVEAQQVAQQVMSRSGSKEPTDVMDTFNKIVSSGSTKDSIRAKLAMMDNIKQQNN